MFGAAYTYVNWLHIPGALNKSAADTAIVLIGLSMILSGVCYFFNLFDPFIIYRKYLGLVGWAFGLAHVLLSWTTLQALFRLETWEKGLMWPALTAFIATIIFTIMALISNSRMAKLLGGKVWRSILRTGYIAVALIFLHVVLLKSGKWITWWAEGMKSAPSLSLLVSIFMLIVLLMRLALWIALTYKNRKVK